MSASVGEDLARAELCEALGQQRHQLYLPVQGTLAPGLPFLAPCLA